MSRVATALSGVLVVAVAALVWLVFRDARSEPYAVASSALSGWKLVQGGSEDPWIAAAQPPAALSSALFKQLGEKAGETLTRPSSITLPLVMRDEYDDGLQGVHSVDTILRFARDAGIETTPFQPVCLAHHQARDGAEVFFVVFDSPAFRQFRQDIIPAFPEHAGTGIYDSGALREILVLGATDDQFARWWPITVDDAKDCIARVLVK